MKRVLEHQAPSLATGIANKNLSAASFFFFFLLEATHAAIASL